MSEEKVELVKRFFQAFNERDLGTFLALAHPDFEYHGLAWQVDEPRVLRGREGLQRLLARPDSEFDEFRAEPVELVDAGDRVVSVFEVSAIGKQSRAPVSFTDAAVYTISDGLITRCQICGTREKALEAVGLSE